MRPPRVAIVSDERYPSSFADTQQVMKNAAALSAAGLDVELFIPRRGGRPGWSDERRLAELEIFYGLRATRHIRFFGGPAARDHACSRLAVKLAHGAAMPVAILRRGFDIVYTRNRLPALLGLALGLRVVFETYRALGDEHPCLARAIGHVARRPDAALSLVQHSASGAQSLVRAGVPAERILVAHSGYDPADMEPRLSRSEARARLAGVISVAPSRPLVVYAGNTQRDKGVERVVDLAALVPEAEFLLVGGQPAHVARVAAHGREQRADNVRLTGLRPVGDLAPFLYAADVLVIPPTRQALRSGRTVLPLKVFSYLAAGRPILAPRLPDTSEIFVDGVNALLVEPDDVAGCAEALRALLAKPVLAQGLAERARARARTLTWDARARRIQQFLVAGTASTELSAEVTRRVG